MTLHHALDAGVLTLRIDRQDRMNALDGPTATALIDALGAIERDVRVVVLTGTGNAFSTGADIAEMAASQPRTPEEHRMAAEETMQTASTLVRAVIDAPVPVIAQVNGIAAGIGASMALASDLVYASEDASFLLAFTTVALMPDGGSSLLVPAAIGRVRASAMALLAEPMTAADAESAGLINRVLPPDDLGSHVEKIARRLARGPRRALELTKRALTASTLALLDDAFERERQGQTELLTAPEFREGINAVLDHRRPSFERESPQT
ncbi:enoyl-CoA hydratase [Rhodococcoides kyotonense]|uniref:Enoyl-CoA hydratase/carnithine racemase n=1 Tax=Rhodococcoides kyotonense TaxID=398843 RepID=A0A239F840_9NOCA|nr:enoyl-CoA hydratase [Rhodococcus kyotonensis]SNS53089.1 Enoyl-CoA hydratase/carnithine racemase [Rhodococcus kyotonensis]